MIQKEMSPVTPAPSPKKQYNMTPLVVMLTLFLLLSIYVPATNFQRVKHISTAGQKGQAYVDSIETHSRFRSFENYTVATYHYTARLQDGTTQQFTRKDTIKQDTQVALREKTQADIFYLPENPQEAILALEVFDTPLDYLDLISLPLIPIGFLILTFMLGIFLKNDRRYQKWLETSRH